MNKLEPVTFRLPSKLLTRLRVKSATSNPKRSMQQIVADALKEHLQTPKQAR